MGYYDLLKDMEENRCQGCMFLYITQDMTDIAVEQHKR